MPDYPPREMKLIRSVLQALNALEDMNARHTCDQQAPFSGTLHLDGSWGSLACPVCTAWRIGKKQADLLIFQMRSLLEQQPILLADYISQPMAAMLSAEGIQFFDANGNGSIQAPPLYLQRSGNKPRKKAPLPNRCVQSAGLRVLYQLLQNPDLVQYTYREIATRSHVALGSIGPVLRDLQHKKILSPKDTGPRRILNPAALHQLWESAFLQKLRPRLQLERCSPAPPWSFETLPTLIQKHKMEEHVILGGELAAAFYCDNVDARQITLYVQRSQALKLMLQLRLIPDPDGCIDMVEAFAPNIAYARRSTEGLQLAEPFLVHAELMAGDKRQQQIAKRLAPEYFPF